MKILLAHNSYQQAGGEDTAVNAEINLLRHYGDEVLEYRRSNQDIEQQSRLSTAVSTIWSHKTQEEVRLLCIKFKPDIIHIHNTFPLISPSLYWLASQHRIPLIQTLHNFRLLCPQAMFLREGRVCEDCLGKLPWRAISRRCYHRSAVQSALVTGMLGVHRSIGSYRNQVSAYIVLNEFCREKFIAGGLPAHKLHIKPNFATIYQTPNWSERRGGYYLGRLAEEKGIPDLIKAYKTLNEAGQDCDLKIIGNGPLIDEVRAAFNTHYLGPKNAREIIPLLRSALFLVAPSTCYETFGLAVVEAFSSGVAVIASAHGGLKELVIDGVTGLLFTPGDKDDLARKIAWANSHPDAMLAMGRKAYQVYTEKFTPEKNYQQLKHIYTKALLDHGVRHAN
jgi:glycosyltransferase involved in cell wall biosynthesis